MRNAPKDKLSDVLRAAIIDSGLPHQRIEKETGVQRGSIARFVAGVTSLQLSKAGILADYFGLDLRFLAERNFTEKGE
jgi:hypothetical protein